MTMTVGRRVALGFGFILVLTFALGAYQYDRLSEVLTVTERVTKNDITLSRLLSQLGEKHNEMRSQIDRTVISDLLRNVNVDDGRLGETEDLVRAAYDQTNELLAEVIRFVEPQPAMSISPQRAESWQQILDNLRAADTSQTAFAADISRVFAAMRDDNTQVLANTLPDLATARANFRNRIETAEELTQSLSRGGQDKMLDTAGSAQDILIALIAVAIVAGALIAIFITRSITQPLGMYMRFVEQVGQGDLSKTVPSERRDELGLMGDHLNGMVANLRSVAQQTREAAENLNSASSEALASTQQQNASVEEQYAAIQETTATISEITQSGAQMNERARQVSSSAEAAAQTSSVGIAAIRDTAEAMDMIREQAEAVAENIVALSEKTKAIGEITATVNDIAERSHLLALNAAIEAAAAGENGRGFSVVANEIKNLADQAKEATGQVRANLSDIQQGINTSVMLTEEAVKRVVSGKSKSDAAQQTIHELAENIQNSVEAFQQILAATNQQQIGLEQVSQALQNIRLASEQTSAGANQVEKAASNLTTLGEQLLRTAGAYKW